MAKKSVHIYVRGGVIQEIECPSGVRVVVHDYDIDGSEPNLAKDENDDEYVETIWE